MTLRPRPLARPAYFIHRSWRDLTEGVLPDRTVLDNALGIAPPDTTVMIAVEQGTAQHRLTVTDEGPGLSNDDKDRALRRFWRGDTNHVINPDRTT